MSWAVCVIISGVITKPQFVMTCAALAAVVPMTPPARSWRSRSRVQDTGSRQRHDRHERFGEHAAEADEAHVGFGLDHLRRRPRRDQRMEAGDGAARDRDEEEREELAGNTGPGAVEEAVVAGIDSDGGDELDAQRQRDDGSDLEEGAQVVARASISHTGRLAAMAP
jgi:hypothetical protein